MPAGQTPPLIFLTKNSALVIENFGFFLRQNNLNSRLLFQANKKDGNMIRLFFKSKSRLSFAILNNGNLPRKGVL
ncbi:hypothetical protein EFM20_04830 [Lactiplantibacillus plantarum]|nr:hypothetical protein [Lactiplantibacillus plantarum]